MSEQPQYVTLRDYLAVIRRHRVLVLALVVLCGGAALIWSVLQESTYRAETSLLFREPTEGVELIGIPSFARRTPEERAAIGAQRADQRRNLEAVRRKLGVGGTIEDFEDNVDARAEVRTNLVIVQVKDHNAVQAARIADAIGAEVITSERAEQQRRYDDLIRAQQSQCRRTLRARDLVTRLQRRECEQKLIELRATRDYTSPAEFSQRAVPPSSPISPKPIRNTLLGLLAGLLLGLFGAFLRSALDRRLQGTAEIQQEADLPIMGAVRETALGRANLGDPETGRGEAEIDLEAFRIVQTNLDYLDVDNPLTKVLVTSPMPEEGKSTVASSLAVVAGLSGRRTLLVECDLRRPRLADRLGIEPVPGLVDYLTGQAQPTDVLRTISLGPATSPNGAEPAGETADGAAAIAVIPAGSQPLRPAELLASQRFESFVASVSQVYDLVVFDSAPLLAVSDTLDLVRHVDGILLCVRAGQTTRDQLRGAMQALGRLPGRPAGLVVTGVSPGTAGDYGYYGYAYGDVATS